MEEPYTSEILATLLTSSQCKGPIAESTLVAKLSNFLIQLEEKLLQSFDHVEGIGRTIIRGRSLELTFHQGTYGITLNKMVEPCIR
jgi:hypothetical protein